MEKKIIRLTEEELYSLLKESIDNVLNDSLNTVRLQLINGYFYPTDSISRNILNGEFNLDRFPKDRIDALSPTMVRKRI